jgi:MoaA/NifB/PqqE/SkfB family radical SAM enzyme
LLYASNAKLYKTLTGKDNFSNILTQIKYLAELRRDKFNPAIHLTLIITTLNIEDLPDFVKLALSLGIDKIICQYSCIYKPTQKYLSCFFKQKITNEMLDRAEELAKKLNIEIELPPRFDREIHSNSESNLCNKAWSQIIIDTQGNILTCDTGRDCNEGLQERDFMDVWNGHYYQNLRESLTKGNCNCFKYCFRANPICVNDFRAHVNLCGKKASEIDILWADNF